MIMQTRASSCASSACCAVIVVAEAHDGPSGIETALAFRPDVAFVDIKLPHVDGFGVARALREQMGIACPRLDRAVGVRRIDCFRSSACGRVRRLCRQADRCETARELDQCLTTTTSTTSTWPRRRARSRVPRIAWASRRAPSANKCGRSSARSRVSLFERQPGGLKLTEAGRLAFEHTSVMFRAGERLSEALGHDHGQLPRTLRIGLTGAVGRTTTANFLLPLLAIPGACRASAAVTPAS